MALKKKATKIIFSIASTAKLTRLSIRQIGEEPETESSGHVTNVGMDHICVRERSDGASRDGWDRWRTKRTLRHGFTKFEMARS